MDVADTKPISRLDRTKAEKLTQQNFPTHLRRYRRRGFRD
jgi:hypothetical protein